MKIHYKQMVFAFLTLCTLATSGALFAEKSAGERLDKVIDKTEDKAEELSDKAKKAAEDAKDKIRKMKEDAKDRARKGIEKL